MTPIVTVGALIYDAAGRVLLVRTHKWGDRLGIPGGKIHHGETMEEALVREIAEETGLFAHGVRFALVQDSVFSPEFHEPRHFVLLNFIARVEGEAPEVTLNDEAEAWCWATPEEALAMDLNTPTRKLIEILHG